MARAVGFAARALVQPENKELLVTAILPAILKGISSMALGNGRGRKKERGEKQTLKRDSGEFSKSLPFWRMNNFRTGAASLQKANPKTHRLLAKFSVFVLTTNTSPAPHPPQSTIAHSLYGPPNFSQILVNVFVLLLQLYFITLRFLIRINHLCCFRPAPLFF